VKRKQCSPESEYVSNGEDDSDSDGESKVFSGVLDEDVSQRVVEDLILQSLTVLFNVVEDVVNMTLRFTDDHDEANKKHDVDETKHREDEDCQAAEITTTWHLDGEHYSLFSISITASPSHHVSTPTLC